MVEAREFLCLPRWCASPLLPEVILLGKVMRLPTRLQCDPPPAMQTRLEEELG